LIDSKLKSLISEEKERINLWLRLKIQSMILEFVDKARPKVKQAVKDPDMCQFVKDAVDVVVDSSWEVLTDEIKYNL
jgi:hypothetical protein